MTNGDGHARRGNAAKTNRSGKAQASNVNQKTRQALPTSQDSSPAKKRSGKRAAKRS